MPQLITNARSVDGWIVDIQTDHGAIAKVVPVSWDLSEQRLMCHRRILFDPISELAPTQ